MNSHCISSISDITAKNSIYCQIFIECCHCICVKRNILEYEILHFECIWTICFTIWYSIGLWLKCHVFPRSWQLIVKTFCWAIHLIKMIITMKIILIWCFNEVWIRHQNYGKDLMIIKYFLFANFLQYGPLYIQGYVLNLDSKKILISEF